MRQPIIMRRKEVAETLGVSLRAIHKWAKQGILHPVRLPGRKNNLGYRRDDIERLATPQSR